MNTSEDHIDKSVAKKITRLYVLALAAIATFSILGQIAIQHYLLKQTTASRVINIAGRQRMLSQKICKDIVLISTELENIDRKKYLNDLEKHIPVWKKNHEDLRTGILSSYEKSIVQNSTVLDSMFRDIDYVFYTIYGNAVTIKDKAAAGATSDDLIYYTQSILRDEQLYLQKQDRIVFAYDAETKERIEQLRITELSLLIITIVVLVLEGIFIFRPAVNYIRKTIEMLLKEEQKTKLINARLNEANASLKESERLRINAQRLRALALIKGQEDERNRIAKELHDGLGQILTTLKLTFESLNTDSFSSEKEKKKFNQGQELIKETITEVRNISFNLMPAVLSDFGIASAVRMLCNRISHNTAKAIVFKDDHWPSDIRLDQNIEIGLYRITQEALNNAIKYSGSEKITIQLSMLNDIIELSVFDDGVGFELDVVQSSPAPDNRKNGISNMQQRAEIIGGSMKIISAQGQGTRITAKIPINN